MATWHLNLASDGRDALFPSEASRYAAVRALARAAAPHLAVFCITDTNVHLVIQCSTARAGRIARAVLLGLRPLTPLFLEPATRHSVPHTDYLSWLAGRLLGQLDLPGHPALWPGSSVTDLVGARALEGPPLLLPRLLPGFGPAQALLAVGLDPAPLTPVGDRDLLLAGPGRLLRASAAAVAADPALQGRASAVVSARQSAAQLGRAAGVPTRTLATALELTTHGVRRLQRLPANLEQLAAVRTWLALEDRVLQGALAAS